MFTSDGSARPFSPLGATTQSRRYVERAIALIRNSVAVASLMVLSALLGSLVTSSAMAPKLNREGACIAMDVAMAYGFVDEHKRKVVTRAITDTSNPYASRFTGGYRKLNEACSDIARNRWSQ